MNSCKERFVSKLSEIENLENSVKKITKSTVDQNKANIHKLIPILSITRKGLLQNAADLKITQNFEDQLLFTDEFEDKIFTPEIVDKLKNDKISDIKISNLDSNYIESSKISLEIRDCNLQNKIRKLQWVTPYMLGIENFDDREASNDQKFLESAITKIIELDAVCTPGQKLRRIMEATKMLLDTKHIETKEIGKNSNSQENLCETSHFSADDLTPLIIMLIIRSNPAMLLTNLFFIELFYDSDILNSGQEAFLFTQFSSAVRWLESEQANSNKNFRVTFEQFQAYRSTCAFPEEIMKRSPKVMDRSLRKVEQDVST